MQKCVSRAELCPLVLQGNLSLPLLSFWVAHGLQQHRTISAFIFARLLLCVSLCVLSSSCKDVSHQIQSLLYIQDDFISRSLTDYICKGHISKYSHSQLLGRDEFWGATIQPILKGVILPLPKSGIEGGQAAFIVKNSSQSLGGRWASPSQNRLQVQSPVVFEPDSFSKLFNLIVPMQKIISVDKGRK